MYQFDKIKLVIWDLDETFWNGTLTEGGAMIPPAHCDLLLNLTDAGIVNSICSKNDWEPVRTELEKQGLLQYFVFPSVNWESKGNRIKALIADMQLRPANVLFLDDNHSNREEARFFCPEIMVAGPEEIPTLIGDVAKAPKKDKDHKRLKQYRVLEEKRTSRQSYSSNEAFLAESNIRLEIATDSMAQLARIHDLLLRSNQLNFTKVRSTEEELTALLSDPEVKAGYVSVSDKFGDYGIVGFYALKEGKAIHFTFSCRTLGMGIEQYVYNHLGRPELEIVGEVISDLSSTELPSWINQASSKATAEKAEIKGLTGKQVLIKGPCDLLQILPYIANSDHIDTDFTFVAPNGVTVESTGHTTHIVESIRLKEEQKQRIIGELPFAVPGTYNPNLFEGNYRVAIISILQDANLGVYERIGTGERIAFIEYLRPLTDPANWEGYLKGEFDSRGCQFTKDILETFSKNYKFIGRNSPEQTVENLRYIRQHLPKECTLVIMLGGELHYEKNTFPAYEDRYLVHQRMNAAIREFAAQTEGIRLLDVNKYLVDQSSFYDHYNHYIKPVYYSLAKDMIEIINECTGSDLKETSRLKILKIRIKEFLAPLYYKLKNIGRKGH